MTRAPEDVRDSGPDYRKRFDHGGTIALWLLLQARGPADGLAFIDWRTIMEQIWVAFTPLPPDDGHFGFKSNEEKFFLDLRGLFGLVTA